MRNIHHKHQILESLNSMDQAQMESVLKYVKGILEKPASSETDYERFKRNAMREIRQALKK
jgi:hypothetical protein